MSSIVNFYKGFLSTQLNAGEASSSVLVDRITNAQGETIATSDFADFARGILTINPNADGITEYPENASFTTVGSTGFTGAIRGLDKSGVTQTSLMRYHPIGTPVIISIGTHNLQDIKSYVDTQIAATAIGTANVAVGTAGETLVAGNLVYLKNDGKWWKIDADTAATIDNIQLGITQGAGSADATITNGVMLKGLDTHQSGLVAGTTYYASNTAGGISSSAGTTERIIGIGRSSTSIYFDPNYSYIPTSKQKTAIANLANGIISYAADAQANDTYVVTLSPVPGAYADGMTIRFKANTANTDASTLNVNTLGAIAILRPDGTALQTGDIVANQIVEVVYRGGSFYMVSASVLPLNHFIGALPPAFVKTYFNTQFPFIVATGTVDGALTTDFPHWIRGSTDVAIQKGGMTAIFNSTGQDHLTIKDFCLGSAGSLLDYDDNNIIVFDAWLKVTSLVGDVGFGFGEAGTLNEVYDNNGRRIAFNIQATGTKLWARLGDGTTDSGTDISSGITLTNWNNYRIVADLGASSADFYVNGVLKATLTTNFPITTGGVDMEMGFGRNTDANFQVTAPNFSIEMNP